MKTVDILICTLDEGIYSAQNVVGERRDNIKYIISWQRLSSTQIEVPEKFINRDDVFIYELSGKGLSRNRNNALRYAESDICFIADDDVEYDFDKLQELVNYYESNPEIDLITFKYRTKCNGKQYPVGSFDLRNKPNNFNISSIEISFKRKSVQGRIFFNELLGLGSPKAGAGEDDIFILDCLDSGLKCCYLPITVVTHNDSTTGVRDGGKERVIFSRGILTRIMHPRTYPFYYVYLARSIVINHKVPFLSTITTLFKGGIYAKKNNMVKYDIKKIFIDKGN